jgi:hypothetical protein
LIVFRATSWPRCFRAIAAGVLEYRKFEPLLTRFEELALRMR